MYVGGKRKWDFFFSLTGKSKNGTYFSGKYVGYRANGWTVFDCSEESYSWVQNIFLCLLCFLVYISTQWVGLHLIFSIHISFELRKLYWTDGNTINMANMDGSNSKILFQNQKEPVGKYFLIVTKFSMWQTYTCTIYLWSRS